MTLASFLRTCCGILPKNPFFWEHLATIPEQVCNKTQIRKDNKGQKVTHGKSVASVYFYPVTNKIGRSAK